MQLIVKPCVEITSPYTRTKSSDKAFTRKRKPCYTTFMQTIDVGQQNLLAKPKTQNRNRVWEIDTLRGICILLMLLDHFMFNFMILDLSTSNWLSVNNRFFQFMNAYAIWYWEWAAREVIRFCVVFLFLLLSGISCTFSRNNKNRLFKLATAAAIVTLATYGIDMAMHLFSFGRPPWFNAPQLDLTIVFGILHIMAVSLGLYMFIQCMGKKFAPLLSLIIGSVILVFGFRIPFFRQSATPFLNVLNDLQLFWWLVLGATVLVLLFLETLWRKRYSKQFQKKLSDKQFFALDSFLRALGIAVFVALVIVLPIRTMQRIHWQALWQLIVGTGAIGSDFYGIFPFVGVFLIGASLGKILYRKKQSSMPIFDARWNHGLSFVGRNAIWFYLIHQIALFTLVMLGAMLAGYRFF